MAVYKDLLLREGGGILSSAQMAEELKDKAAILIGLGGTGIDCLREIKKAVRVQIRPENPNADSKKWRNIHFLAVDSDPESGIREFGQEEQISLYGIPARQMLRSRNEIKLKPELDWLDKDIIAGDLPEMGTGGLRQIGRFLFMERSDVFVSRMQELLARAKAEAESGKPVLIHVFTGLGGGTGSGIFLDVCYLIRHIAENDSRGNVLLSGYFFLPDVNLDKIPPSASEFRSHVEKNGYAAMQELDYCMRLPQNGGSFTQTYKGDVKAEWNVPPVDLCWLLSATDRSFRIRDYPYRETMKFAAEYAVDGLLKPWNVWQLELTNMGGMMRHADQEKRYGYHLHYLSPGGAGIVWPRREMLTYLVSKVFEVFSGMSDHEPSEAEVQAIADAAGITRVEALLNDLTKNGGNSELATALDTFDMKFIRDCGDEQLLYHYTNQKADKMGIIVKNARSMMDEKNSDSLIARICAQLDACAMDLNRGPSYAYKVVQASFAGNMLNMIDGMIKTIQSRLDQRNHNVYDQPDSASKLYEESRQIWYINKNKNRRKANRAFDQYVFAMENLIRGQIEIAQLEQLLAVMKKLEEQVQKKADEYYLKFSRVMENLTATFAENRNALNNGANAVNSNSYAVPMMNIQQIRSLLDREVRQMDMTGLLRQFVTCMFTPDRDGNPVWFREEESRIAEAVRQFFAEQVFSGIANSSMAQLAAAVTGKPADAAVKMMLERGGMAFLKNASEIAFSPDQCIYGGPYNGMVQITVPDGDDTVLLAVENAVKSDPGIRIRKSAQRDRISMFRFMAGFPVSAYANCGWYEKAYWEDFWPGRHLYTGTGGSALFHDWNRMPPLTPRSLMADGELPARVKALFQEAEELYEEAVAMGVIEGDVIFCVPDEVPGELEGMMKRAQKICSWIRQFPDFFDNAMASNMKKLLTELREEYCSVRHPSGYRMDSGHAPTAEICERIRRDFFLSSPALHTVVRREMEKLEGYAELYRQWNAYQKGKDRWFGIRNFCMALCTGVFTWDMGFRISCDIEAYGIPVSELLTDFRPHRFPYVFLPLYQAYLSCLDLEEEKKQAIIEETKRRWDDCENSPEVVKCVRACEAKIDRDYVHAFLQRASEYPEKEQEMKQFIKMFMRELEAIAVQTSFAGK